MVAVSMGVVVIDGIYRIAVVSGIAGACIGSALSWFAVRVCGVGGAFRRNTFEYVPARNPRPPKPVAAEFARNVNGSTDGLEDVHKFSGGAELVNELVARQWSYINTWFGKTIRELLEPTLGKYGHVTTCHLGEFPAFLDGPVSTSTYLQDWPGDAKDRRNFRIEAKLDCSGNGKIEIDIDYLRHSVALSLVVRGTVAVELVQMTSDPPWFRGLRVYFPDMPDIHFQEFERPAWLNSVTNLWQGKSLDVLVLDLIKDGIAQNAVLPKHFYMTLLDMDPIFLGHPRPQGVLRVVSEGIRQDVRTEASTSDPDVRVEMRLGSDARHDRCKHGASGVAQDFLVHSWLRQRLSVRCDVLPEPSNGFGSGEASLLNIIELQGLHAASTYGMRLKPSGRTLQLKAEWRPFARQREEIRAVINQPERCLSHLGVEHRAAWAVFVDLYNATGLPPAPSGTEHWAEIHVVLASAQAKDPLPMVPECPRVGATTLEESGRAALASALGLASTQFAHHTEGVSWQEWRGLLRREGPIASRGEGLDAVWDRSFSCLLNTAGSVTESMGAAQVQVSIMRSSPRARGRKENVGSAVFPLGELLNRFWRQEADDLHMADYFPLQSAGGCSSAYVKLGIHVRLLQAAPVMHRPSRWTTFNTDMGAALTRQLSDLRGVLTSSRRRRSHSVGSGSELPMRSARSRYEDIPEPAESSPDRRNQDALAEDDPLPGAVRWRWHWPWGDRQHTQQSVETSPMLGLCHPAVEEVD
mmetsp:Transcript_115843/g.327761  ORF Transcript_115843/g.327761 Transcript_115843/m.327761 type:complete len:752 (-) Transcript_115843:137-2392(-)|eukprot:CAMPEP_0117504754 /NCGR_PEP_ID=MMETSP0784-20121206/25013_1 /TAXON_ID=39447 /ORGANISM="" /LENGTH=751 /DNA_ID=CAMNT_0005300121 /DNA_START=27 /DNA_END=2282 /DNA_ORIENTATION=-